MYAASCAFWLAMGFGFFAGLGTVAILGRWLRFILGLRQGQVVGGRGKAQFRVLGIPLLGFVSPTPWLGLVGLPYAAYHFIYIRKSHSAAVFFGMIGALVFVWLFVSAVAFLYFRRRRRNRVVS
jgi:hypothetical protein